MTSPLLGGGKGGSAYYDKLIRNGDVGLRVEEGGRAGPSPSGALSEVDRGGPPTQVNLPIDMGVKL